MSIPDPRPPIPSLIHASCVALEDSAVLVRGASGSGKSDLCLRLIEAGCRLVADDQVCLDAREGALWASPPETLAGLIEARAVGLLRFPFAPKARVALVIDLAGEGEALERMPDEAFVSLCGVHLPVFRLEPFQASTVAKIKALLHCKKA